VAAVDVMLNELLSNLHLRYLSASLKYVTVFKCLESMLFITCISSLRVVDDCVDQDKHRIIESFSLEKTFKII